MRWSKLRPHFFPILTLVVVLLFLTRNLWGTRAWIETHDGIFHLIRQGVMVEMLKSGAFPVRWVSSLDNGFGLPLFTYMYPGPYYLGAPLALLGLSTKWVIKLVTIFLYFLGTFGIYTLLQKTNKLQATLSALLYATTPYLLLNIFVRGALGEFMAISLVPWILLSLSDLRSSKRLRWYHPLPYAFMLLSHNFLSLLFLPVILLLSLFLYRPKPLSLTYSLLASFGLSAFFVLPMILSRGDLASFSSSNFTYLYRDHFVYFSQLFYSKWGIGHSYAGTADGFSFALGIPALLILLSGIVRSLMPRPPVGVKVWTALTLFSIFLLLPISRPLWDALKPLQIIQFPWRLLSFYPIGIPLLSFALLESVKTPKPRTQVLLFLLLASSLIPAYLHTIPPYYQSNDQLAQQLYIHREQTTTSSRLEILPKWVSPEARYHGDEHFRLDAGEGTLTPGELTPLNLTLTAELTSPTATLRLRRNYYPGWVVQDSSGTRYPTFPTPDGELGWIAPAGLHHFRLTPRSTTVELVGNTLSLLSVATLLGYSIITRQKSQHS